MESLARKYWKDKDKIAKLTSYGSYLDCEYITARYPEDESHIVGDLAEYVYDLEQKTEEQEAKIVSLKDTNKDLTELIGMKDKTFVVIEIDEFYKQQNQTSIAELEKVKEEMVLNGNSYCEIRQGTSPHNPTDYAWFNYVKFRNYLDQQIKELKGEK